MEEEKKITPKHVGIAAGIGFLIGAIVAIFVTPKTGKETRKIVAEKVVEVKSKVEDTVDKVKSAINKQKAHQ
jgi:gas vesicle protein